MKRRYSNLLGRPSYPNCPLETARAIGEPLGTFRLRTGLKSLLSDPASHGRCSLVGGSTGDKGHWLLGWCE